MTTLCKMFCPEDLRREMEVLQKRLTAEDKTGVASAKIENDESSKPGGGYEEEEEQEEEEEEQEEEEEEEREEREEREKDEKDSQVFDK